MRPSARFKDSIYEQIARIGKALSAPKRLELLDLLCEAPRTVEALARLAALSTANASQHLRVLHRARLVIPEKQGLFVQYRIADEGVGEYLQLTQQLAEARLTEIGEISRAFLKERGTLEDVSGEELLQRVRAGEVIVLDVRPLEEYEAGHLPGARSIPLKELTERLRELPKNREIVAYCRGRYCVMAIEAVEGLRKAGYRAQRMEYGVRDWRARGWRTETGAPRMPRQGARS
jgi:rhodanese-related sulfurtransferase